MPSARVHIKIAEYEIEYEGDDTFAREGALTLLLEAIEKAQSNHVPFRDPGGGVRSSMAPGPVVNSGLTISTIAAHLNPDGTQDLAMCALAKIQLIDGKSQAEKGEIWEEMKGASGYFKASMAKNFPRDLGRMVRGKKINEVGAHVYSLTASSAKELEATLANIE